MKNKSINVIVAMYLGAFKMNEAHMTQDIGYSM